MSNKEVILAKWLEGSLSEEEVKELSKQYDLDELGQVLSQAQEFEADTVSVSSSWDAFQELKEQVSFSEGVDSNKLDNGQNKNLDRSVSDQANAEESHEHDDSHHHHHGHGNSGYLPLIILASLVVIGLFLAYFFLGKEDTSVSTNNGEKLLYALEDGSSIDIGQGSRISYDAAAWDKQREVSLHGQALFSVEKGSPFTVETKAGTVTVLGTKFDVWCINEKWLRVQCLEGRVSVRTGNEEIILTVGKEVSLIDGRVEQSIILPDKELDWQDNYRNYRNTDLEIVLEDMSRFYTETFVLEKAETNEVFSGTIPTDNLEKAKEYLQLSVGYEYRNSSDTIYFSPIQ